MIGTTRSAIRRPLLWAAMCFVAAVVPMGLQALDLLPQVVEWIQSQRYLSTRSISRLAGLPAIVRARGRALRQVPR